MNWHKFKIGLLVLTSVLVVYIALIVLDKRAQWKAFLELEQEQLAIVTAEGFVEREFGVDSRNRAKIVSVSGYARYTSDYTNRIYGESAIRAFLAFAPKPKFDDFTLVYSAGLGSGQRFGYPVSLCGDGYCDFDPDLIIELGDYRGAPYDRIFHSSNIERSGYKFSIYYYLSSFSNENLSSHNIRIGSEPRNFLDELWAEILQIPSGYSFNTIYRVDYVTGWDYLREEITPN